MVAVAPFPILCNDSAALQRRTAREVVARHDLRRRTSAGQGSEVAVVALLRHGPTRSAASRPPSSCLGDDENQRDGNEQEQQRKDELLPNGFGKLRLTQARERDRRG